MNRLLPVLAVAVVAALLLLASRHNAPAAAPQDDRWEYLLLDEVELNDIYRRNQGNDDIGKDKNWADRALTSLGESGWELVDMDRDRFVLKRPVHR